MRIAFRYLFSIERPCLPKRWIEARAYPPRSLRSQSRFNGTAAALGSSSHSSGSPLWL